MKLELEQKDILDIARNVAALIAKQTPQEAEVMTVKDMALFLQVDDSWVYKAVSANSIPYFKAGKYTRFRRRDIEKWIDGEIIGAITPAPLIVSQQCRGKR